jgi:hypothetical protein
MVQRKKIFRKKNLKVGLKKSVKKSSFQKFFEKPIFFGAEGTGKFFNPLGGEGPPSRPPSKLRGAGRGTPSHHLWFAYVPIHPWGQRLKKRPV